MRALHHTAIVNTQGGNFYSDTSGSNCLQANTWYFMVGTASQQSGTYNLYINGADAFGSPESFSGTLESATGFYIGEFGYQSAYLNAQIANVQIYNASLSQNSIQALYYEGIGGVPINLRNLVGWWSLNGNADDYSGNGNNGASTAITYTSNWYSNYATP